MPLETANPNRDKSWGLISLPPFPAVAMRILDLLSKDDIGMNQVSKQIQADPALAAEVLKLANSALFGFRSEIKTVLQATALMGQMRVKAVALTIAMRVYLTQSFQMPALLATWRHGLATALLAEQLAVACVMEKDFAYLAGLLHDIGRMALAMLHPIEYGNLFDVGDKTAIEVLEMEREMFGVDHCHAGKWLAQSWKLPPKFAEITSRHHAKPDGNMDIVWLVHHACRLADAIGFESIQYSRPSTVEEILQSLPDRVRNRYDPNPALLAADIAIKIQALENPP